MGNPISRRALLASAIAAPRIAAAASSDRKWKLVVTGGHPGDPEYGCGGTIARLTRLGHEAALVYLNRGEGGIAGKSGEESGRIRSAEAEKACQLLNARAVFAGQIDGRAVVDAAHESRFTEILEAEHPDILLTHWPIDNHADHRAISMLTNAAWLRLGRKASLYYYEVSNGEDTQMFSPDHYVDITAVTARKRAACYAHASQSPDSFYDLQVRVTRFRGIESGHAEAEAYVRHVKGPDLLSTLAL